jgi:4-diphosphocytidyl-2-C-methyl-D-erythritol kinase
VTRKATVRAFAKLNLSLLVLGKRADGYHELRTVFQTISLADRIHLEWTPGALWSVDATPEINNNLAVNAAEVLRAETTRLRGHLKIHIEKVIPMGGGLGGGSSNAAAILLALPTLAGLRVPVPTLMGLATSIGSDVPFFLEGGTALGLGRGEELYPVPTPKQRLAVVVTPGISVATPDAFRALNRGPLGALTFTELSNRISNLRGMLSALSVSSGEDAADWRQYAENDFESVVFERHPKLGALRRQLERRGAQPARMSGSGSTIFGVFSGKSEQLAVAGAMAPNGARTARLVSRNEYRGAWGRALAEHKVGNAWPPHSRYASSK